MPDLWCDICQAAECVVCHECGAPLDEFRRCSAGPCWEAVVCPDCRTRFNGEDGYVAGEPCPICWVVVGGVLEVES